MANKIDSNATACYIAEEAANTPKTLPGSPIWREQEPNAYNDFGGEFTSVARDPISASRQRKRGTITDLEAAGGYNTDITQNNMTRLLQGFLFADAHEKMDTAPFNGTAITITNIDGTNDEFDAASGLDGFAAGDILLGSGFTQAAANALHVVQSVTSDTSVETNVDLANETPPAGAKLEAVGFQFASGDLTMTVAAGVATIGATTKDLTELGLQVGEWIYVGGDDAAHKFATCPNGYARVKSVSATAIVLDKVTAAFVTDNGSGKTVRMFFGKFIRNESSTNLIKTRTYQIERQLGSDGVGVQSEYIIGALANEFKLNLPSADKLNADLTFLAMEAEYRTGTTGIKSGTRVTALGEDPFNTSRNVYRVRMNIIDPATLQPTALFAYITEGSITINNNASLAKAVGVLGAFDVTVGTFEVGGELQVYFANVAALAAIKDNSDVTMDIIFAKENAGMVFDLPMFGLGNGRLNIEKDQAVRIPLETLAAEGATGYTLGITSFTYLPTAAMPA